MGERQVRSRRRSRRRGGFLRLGAGGQSHVADRVGHPKTVHQAGVGVLLGDGGGGAVQAAQLAQENVAQDALGGRAAVEIAGTGLLASRRWR